MDGAEKAGFFSSGRRFRRPLVEAAGLTAAGMAAGLAGADHFSPSAWLFAAGMLGGWALLFRRHGEWSRPALWGALFAAAAFRAADLRMERSRSPGPPRWVEAEGRIAGEPLFRPRPGSKGEGSWTFLLRGVRCREKKGDPWRKAEILPWRVRVWRCPPDAPFQRGARVHCRGKLRPARFPGPTAAELTVFRPRSIRVTAPPPPLSPGCWGTRWRRWAQDVLGRGVEETSPVETTLYRALLLGTREEVPAEVYEAFRRTGTVHIFALSGLHVGMLGVLLALVLRLTGVSRDRWGLFLLPLLGLYVAATGMRASALRAWLMAAVYFLAPLFRRQPDAPSSVAAAALVLLFADPANLLSIGFLYSFIVVAFLVTAFETRRPAEPNPGEPLVRFLLRRRAGAAVRSAATAFIASAPLTALFFGRFSVVAVPANLVVVPLTFLVVLCGWSALLFPPGAAVFNQAAAGILRVLERGIGALAQVPGAWFPVSPPPLVAVACWYAGWMGWFIERDRFRRRAWTVLILLGLAGAVTAGR